MPYSIHNHPSPGVGIIRTRAHLDGTVTLDPVPSEPDAEVDADS